MTKLMDVTLREVGEACGYHYSLEHAVRLARCLSRIGIEAVEIGYVRPREWDGTLSARTCSPSFVNLMREALDGAYLVLFAHLREIPVGSLDKLADSGIDMIRFAVAADDPSTLQSRASEIRNLNAEFSVNATRVTEHDFDAIMRLGHVAQELGARTFYVADSNGSLFPEQVAKIGARLRAELSLELGGHFHDHLGLAIANAIQAQSVGFDWLDGSLRGKGKDGGNLQLELIALHLQAFHERRYGLAALAELADEWSGIYPKRRRTFWAAVHGAYNINQDRIAAFRGASGADRILRYERELGIRLTVNNETSDIDE